MLQHNIARAGDRAHVAHAAMISLHALCCGLPIVALMLAALSGASSGATAFLVVTRDIHGALHAHEIWILAGSALLVSLGGVMELAARRNGMKRGTPWLFALSLACFAFNLAIILVHRA